MTEQGNQKVDKPEQVKDVDITQLRKLAQDYIDVLDEWGPDVNSAHNLEVYIFEEAIRAIFGKDVFKWTEEINRRFGLIN